jgi:hypothetical protein
MRQARGIAAAVFGVLLALTAAAPARAQVPCSTVCSRYDQGQCVEYTHYGCTTPSAPTSSYGAIAYGRTSNAFGYSYSWGSEAKAESVAMQNCGQHGNDCEVMVWFEHKCGAVASGGGTTAFWGLGDSDGQARADAQNKCVNGGGKDCEVQVSQCSTK